MLGLGMRTTEARAGEGQNGVVDVRHDALTRLGGRGQDDARDVPHKVKRRKQPRGAKSAAGADFPKIRQPSGAHIHIRVVLLVCRYFYFYF